MTLLEFYNLQDIMQMFGVDTSTDKQLEEWGRKLKIEVQVLMADEVDDHINRSSESSFSQGKRTKLSIINYQDSDEQGSHWVGYFNGEKEFEKGFEKDTARKEPVSFYFDPYGIEPLPDFPKCIFNSVQVQPFGTRLCGQLSLYFLFKMNKCECGNKSQKFDDIIEEMLDCLWPESLL